MRLGMLASGSGSSVQSLCDRIYAGGLDGFAPAVVLCNKAPGTAGIYARAERIGVPVLHAERPDDQLSLLDAYGAQMLLGLGHLKLVESSVLEHFGYRGGDSFAPLAWNIHPAVDLHRFGGKGMYGHHVHDAVIAAGEKESGATVHMMGERYDDPRGILQQVRVPVFPTDTPETLQQRVLQFEYPLMATTLAAFRDNLLPNCPNPWYVPDE
ncbi:hypothetical protein AUJ68_05255 [Candidatus Woesearchaeota archaeon CG1_02_57_44]|nr:MAG: hypothetical protein AUJ68_05255 [Candidatus Woesearchaeota archaeon CG1_02_57_44]